MHEDKTAEIIKSHLERIDNRGRSVMHWFTLSGLIIGLVTGFILAFVFHINANCIGWGAFAGLISGAFIGRFGMIFRKKDLLAMQQDVIEASSKENRNNSD